MTYAADLAPHPAGRRALALLLTAALSLPATSVLAQRAHASDAAQDAQDARTDAMLGTLNSATPAPLTNLYATAPGLEEQIPAPQWRVNLLAPLTYDSNPLGVPQGATQTLGTSPFGSVSWAAPLGSLPFRVTLSANSVFNRYFEVPSVDNNRITVSGRLQYVNPANDQAFSPFFAVAPRWSYLPSFSDQTEARQDFNLGFNKRFNFDGAFRPLAAAGDTSAQTVWSFGVTAFAQRRLREPQISSSAVFVIPSVSYVINKDWNASFAIEFLGRWFDADLVGNRSRVLEVMPIATLEYVIPASFLGGDRMATILGRPAIDLQGSHLNLWSSVPGVDYGQWEAQAAIKMGWSF